ncbi:MAG: lipopolysaccharide biosynthesis regulator YciM [Candidatus Azotimanducaceae bacterium]
MDSWLLYGLIVAAIGVGWMLGRRERSTHNDSSYSPNYYQGLNHLLNEEPDRAVAPFLEDLEVNNDTLETHLALGGLLRRRGELDKAVVVHENILANTQLKPESILRVQLELARDYLLAGLLDRAEDLLLNLNKQLSEEHPSRYMSDLRRQGRKLIIEIYEREKEWHSAIEIGEMLAVGDDTEKYERAISHYYCEFAEECLKVGKVDIARQAISDAIGHDANNARVSLVLGKLELKEGCYTEAIRALTRIKNQDPVYVPESLEPLVAAYAGEDQDEESKNELRDYLFECLDITPSISIVLTLAVHLREEQGDEAVAKFIANYLKENPTIRGLSQLIDLHIDNTHGVSKQNLLILRSFAEALVANKPAYRCKSCGFDGKKMRWHCPSCKAWGTIEPIFGLEGE